VAESFAVESWDGTTLSFGEYNVAWKGPGNPTRVEVEVVGERRHFAYGSAIDLCLTLFAADGSILGTIVFEHWS
jgi:hypothetical protein